MREYAEAIFKVRPRLEKLETKLDAMLDKMSMNRSSNTFELMTSVMGVIELKRMVVDMARAYDAMKNVLTEREAAVYEAKTAGKSDEAIAAELGVCRATVSKQRVSAQRKCEAVLCSLKKRGLDVTACKDAFAMAGMKIIMKKAA